ncbi:hypothetical protein NW752_006993 [Fusarium irregulare]|uniref:Uncharacterized protein n=1 Tax=Fusarium irregulare TaxID=2494466 RepID=A0A9W8PTZ7_9HYPO|nr:hypothetical protein NW766_005878 [Fusarium irregulare]KAJ4016058.1 hypothetical protein NW752_006993 [Fusarium irregulare]
MSPHHYPGLGLYLRHHDQDGRGDGHNGEVYPIGIHQDSYGSTSEMLLVREVAMMIVMNQLTEKPDWHIKVFDDVIAEKWIEEGLALPVEPLYDDIVETNGYTDLKKLKTILDRKCLEYCINELRAKAEFFKNTHLVPTLDASASVVKSDRCIDESLHKSLQAAFAKLKLEQMDDPDWHPGSNDMVQDLVHPSLYPLIYGHTRVFREEVVGVEDAIDRWSGKGEVIPKNEPVAHKRGYWGGGNVDPPYWSDTYQWLPSNVRFQEGGSVRFTSYINGLHPTKHSDIYRTLEKLIEKALPAWDFCIPFKRDRKMVGACRTKPRFPMPENPDDENEENWNIKPEDVPEAREDHDIPGEDDSDYDSDYDGYYEAEDDDERQDAYWRIIRSPVQPDPPRFKAWKYGINPEESLRGRFKDIQVIVKMASIELTPEKPSFPAGGWHVEGQMNEHIVGTALYYLDSENVTPSSLKFRMQTAQDQYRFQDKVGQDSFSWMERVYGTQMQGGSCLQQYGSVETKEGRLLAFPNVFHHRVSPFELQDKTKPGHRRFIALWLVDPHTRIINTGNVPPQQRDWWLERAFGNLEAEKIFHPVAKLVSEAAPDHPGLQAALEHGTPLPQELMDMVRSEATSSLPMSLAEAKEHRLKLMEERTKFQSKAEQNWSSVEYSFCEH